MAMIALSLILLTILFRAYVYGMYWLTEALRGYL